MKLFLLRKRKRQQLVKRLIRRPPKSAQPERKSTPSYGDEPKLYAFKFGTACAYGVLQTCLILIVLILSEKLSKGSAGSAI